MRSGMDAYKRGFATSAHPAGSPILPESRSFRLRHPPAGHSPGSRRPRWTVGVGPAHCLGSFGSRGDLIPLGRLQLGGDATQDCAQSFGLSGPFGVGSRHAPDSGEHDEQAVAKNLQGVARVCS
jgi:hypothetical protein